MTTTTADRIEYVDVYKVSASLKGGRTISVDEWDERKPIANLFEQHSRGVLLIDVDEVDGPQDTVSMHSDENNRLALITRGIEALENARAALEGAGYTDDADRKG